MAVAMAAMAAFQLASSYFAAENARETARLNNEIADWNAEFAELDAHDAILDGESAIARYQAVVDDTLSNQNVAFAVNDVDATYGSAAEIKKETRFIAELNRMEIEKQAEEKALGYKRQARDFRLQGDINLAADLGRASDIQTQGILNAAKTGISGYGQFRTSQLGTQSFTGDGTSSGVDGWGISSGAGPSGSTFSPSGYQFSTGEF